MEVLEFDRESKPLAYADYEILMSELDHYRCQSQLLHKVNELYRMLSCLTGMASMLQNYSIWLAEHVSHEIVGYINNTRARQHMYCSCHGPHRRLVVQLAEDLLQQDNGQRAQQHTEFNGFQSHVWFFDTADSDGRLVILRRNKRISAETVQLINYSLAAIAEPLARTHDFEELCRQARVDSLTGLSNRHVFDEHVDYMLKRANRHDSPLTLVSMDLDHFKIVNDTMGHLYGDEVLQKVAKTLNEQIRLPDLLVRMGGDEFFLILPDTDMDEAAIFCKRIQTAIDNLDITAGSVNLGISIGMAQWKPGMSKKAWMEQADDALYLAKRRGRNQVVLSA